MIAQNTRFLITGGRGLIGTELHKQLLKLRYEVRIFDIADRSGDVRDFKQLQDALDGNRSRKCPLTFFCAAR